jgi:putative transposase
MEPGRFYHVYNRGNNGENLFRKEEDYFRFLQLYRQYIGHVAATYAYCLLPNHFHLLVRVRDPEEQKLLYQQNQPSELHYKYVPAARQLSHLFNAYTKAQNFSTGRTGSLFQKNFKRKEVTTEGYFTQLICYIHQNPERHGLIADFRLWPHSSYQSLLSERPTNLQRADVLSWFAGSGSFVQQHLYRPDGTDIQELLLE